MTNKIVTLIVIVSLLAAWTVVNSRIAIESRDNELGNQVVTYSYDRNVNVKPEACRQYTSGPVTL